MDPKNARAIVEVREGEHPLDLLKRCGGYYECPRHSFDSNRLGPLVGYAGRYKGSDGKDHQYVGDVYANFARAEEYPHVLHHWACSMELQPSFDELARKADVFCGAPMGGLAFAGVL